MKLRTPSGGIVEATGDEAKRLKACGFSPIAEQPAEKKPAPRKRKTATK